MELNKTYQLITSLSFIGTDLKFERDELVHVESIDGYLITVKRLNKGDTVTVSKSALSFLVEPYQN